MPFRWGAHPPKWGALFTAVRHFQTDEDDARAGHFGQWKGSFVALRDFRRWNKRTAKLLGPNCPADAYAAAPNLGTLSQFGATEKSKRQRKSNV